MAIHATKRDKNCLKGMIPVALAAQKEAISAAGTNAAIITIHGFVMVLVRKAMNAPADITATNISSIRTILDQILLPM